MQLAFFVDSDACTGCRTCQVACKDRHDIPAGVHWRRVIEVTAGGWERKDGAWTSTVVAYHLSVSCLQCQTPVCAAQCATDAIWKRSSDGIVFIDHSRCTKCRKCEADCPYGAIRWDGAAGLVRKCDLCADDIDAGRVPACVAACPNRALEVGDLEELKQRHGNVCQVFPLPERSISYPALVLKPHRHAALAQERGPEVANWEEI